MDVSFFPLITVVYLEAPSAFQHCACRKSVSTYVVSSIVAGHETTYDVTSGDENVYFNTMFRDTRT